MRIIDRKKMIELGLIKEEGKIKSLSIEKTVTSYDTFSEIVYQKICDLDGGTQQDIISSLQQDGWKIEDIQIALSILARQKRIAYFWG